MKRSLIFVLTIGLWPLAAYTQSDPHKAHQPAASDTARGHAHGTPGRHLSQETHDLVKRLQSGSLVIFFRHERTELSKTRDDLTRYDDCSSQRNLSPAGIESAKNTGEVFRILKIPVGEVRASPICRTMATAHFAFGKAAADEGLLAVPGGAPRPFPEIASDLKKRIEDFANAPNKSNAVLIGHFHNPEALSGIFPEEGEALVYERALSGDVKVLGRMTAAGWTDVIHDLRRMGVLADR
jgi:phosphohistidine phosphatase SixA